MNAQTTLVIQTKLVTIQWDPTCVHVILGILAMVLTAYVHNIFYLFSRDTIHSMFKFILFKMNGQKPDISIGGYFFF